MSHRDEPLRAALDESVDEVRIQQMWTNVRSRLEGEPAAARARRRTWAFAGVTVAAAAIILLTLLPKRGHFLQLAEGGVPVARFVPAHAEGSESIQFEEGSAVTLSPATRWIPVRNDRTDLTCVLDEGHAHFSITPNTGRRWTVQVGTTRVVVLGTVFDVDHSPTRTIVSVARGVVQVSGPHVEGETQILRRGERLVIQLTASEEPVVRATPTAPVSTMTPGSAEPVPANSSPATPTNRPSTEWRRLAEAGRHDDAYRWLHHDQRLEQEARNASAERLMMLADVARLSNHPQEAVALLERLLSSYPGSDQAAFAALLIGRLEMDRLGRPARARRALQQALSLGVPAALEGDVRARLQRLDPSSLPLEEAAAPRPEGTSGSPLGDPNTAAPDGPATSQDVVEPDSSESTSEGAALGGSASEERASEELGAL